MIEVLINWIYIGITAYALGFAGSRALEKRFGYRIKGLVNTVAMGLAAATVYAQLFSVVYRVSLLCNLILLLFGIAVYAINIREMAAGITAELKGKSVSDVFTAIILVALWAYFTSRGYMHCDSDLYHAQSIRWIEEYGVVKGLGNLHQRLAYNSSLFALSALYGMKYVFGHSMHAVNGFIALLLSLCMTDIKRIFSAKRLRLSDFARIGAIYYLFLIYDEITSPASDFAVMCTVFFIVVKWLDTLERGEKDVCPYALLCVAGVFAVSLKLTAGFLLLIVISPAVRLVKDRKWKDIMAYLLLGIGVIFPWLLRNIIISGYLIYPYPVIDLFNVDWKLPYATAAMDAMEIKIWGRGFDDYSMAGLSFGEWFPQWFSVTLSSSQKLIAAADIVCTVIGVLMVFRWIVCRNKSFFAEYRHDFFETGIVLVSVISSYLFWQLSAPLFRYGYAYALLVVMLAAGILYELLYARLNPGERPIYFDNINDTGISGKNKLNRHDMNMAFSNKRGKAAINIARLVFTGLVAVAAIPKLDAMAAYIVHSAGAGYFVRQQDYGKYEACSYEIDGKTFYYPKEGGCMGYDAFPSSNCKTLFELRGEDIEQGFRPVR